MIIQLLFAVVDEHLFSLLRAVLTLWLCMLFISYIHIYLALDIGLRIYFKYSDECSRSISVYRVSLGGCHMLTGRVRGTQVCHLCLTVMGQIAIPSLVLMSSYLCE